MGIAFFLFHGKNIPIAAGMESLLETGSQSVSINSKPKAQDFHPTDAFCIVRQPGMWACFSPRVCSILHHSISWEGARACGALC